MVFDRRATKHPAKIRAALGFSSGQPTGELGDVLLDDVSNQNLGGPANFASDGFLHDVKTVRPRMPPNKWKRLSS